MNFRQVDGDAWPPVFFFIVPILLMNFVAFCVPSFNLLGYFCTLGLCFTLIATYDLVPQSNKAIRDTPSHN